MSGTVSGTSDNLFHSRTSNLEPVRQACSAAHCRATCSQWDPSLPITTDGC
ncbi:hypothetical protein ACFFQW_46675 [Umezawaea endophytica]|uniref:Uncharacterized protein n=1 Tax=Umezawaea endophytica TaxID=1654476 RepID=A0A9X2VW28_9PSEU|nr:hypothetical protein [Umezawaea endophytica]MCS7483686.1 hypothetical protein [Umezawaea endophytica]